MIRFGLFPPRCWIFGRRLHHGVFALILLASDWHDRKRWLPDLLKHPEAR